MGRLVRLRVCLRSEVERDFDFEGESAREGLLQAMHAVMPGITTEA